MIASLLALVLIVRPQESATDPCHRLIEQLGADDPGTRDSAMIALRSIGPAAIPGLELAARSTDEEVRTRARHLLRDLDATSALIEDLRQDDTPGNAKHARVLLMKRYGPALRGALAAVIASDDVQQAVEAAFILLEHGDATLVLSADPDLHGRAAAAYLRRETAGFDWLACQVMLRLDPLLPPADEAASWKRALAGVLPHDLTYVARDAWKLAEALKVPYPEPLLRHFMRNLCSDDQYLNSYNTEPFLERIGDAAVPGLTALLKDDDAQARTRAARLLLNMNHEIPAESYADLLGERGDALERVLAIGARAVPGLRRSLHDPEPEVALKACDGLLRLDRDAHAREAWPVLTAIARVAPGRWNRNLRVEAARMLGRCGACAAPGLELLLEDPAPLVALYAARGLAAFDADRHGPALATLALRHLATDGFDSNAGVAMDVLAALGDRAVPALIAKLKSDDDQEVGAAAAVLARVGRLPVLKGRPLDQIRRLGKKAKSADEAECVVRELNAAWPGAPTR